MERSDVSEIGWYEVELTAEGGQRSGLREAPASGSRPTSGTATARRSRQGASSWRETTSASRRYRVGDRAWGIQFHAEVKRENAEVWISRYDTDPNAVAAGFDPEAARAELAGRIGAWNRIGRTLADAFVVRTESLRGVPAGRATA